MGDLLPDQTSTIILRISILEKDVDMLKEQLHNQPKKLHAFLRILLVADILLVMITVGFQAIPLLVGSDAQYINQASLQRVRSQIFARSVLALVYRPLAERIQAFSDIQVSLPLFEQEQTLLTTNNSSEMQILLVQARPDYLALDNALKAILAHPNAEDNINIVQANIVLAHDKAYLYTVNNILAAIQRQSDARVGRLFIIEAIVIFSMVAMFFSGEHLIKAYLQNVQEEKDKELRSSLSGNGL